MDNKKRAKYYGIIGTAALHIALLAVLLLLAFSTPSVDEDGGVPVLMGSDDAWTAQAAKDGLVDVDVLTETVLPPPTPTPSTDAEELITQTIEETVAIESVEKKTEKKKEPQPKPEPVKKETPQPKPEKTREEIEAEAKRIAEEKAERERKEAAERAAKRVSGAFGKGAGMNTGGADAGSTQGKGGAGTGNADHGALTGSGGYGEYDLQGRSIGGSGLPRPEGNFQEEGTVVISITVNPQGRVIDASFDPRRTNTVDPRLRKAAMDAARKARFNEVTTVNNQVGTVTYYFKLR